MRRVTLDLIAWWLREFTVRGPIADCGGANAAYRASQGYDLMKLAAPYRLMVESVDMIDGADHVKDLCDGPCLHRAWGAAICSDTLMYVRDPIAFGENVGFMLPKGGMILATAQEAGARRGDHSRDYFRFTEAGLKQVFPWAESVWCGVQVDPERTSEKYVYLIGRKR